MIDAHTIDIDPKPAGTDDRDLPEVMHEDFPEEHVEGTVDLELPEVPIGALADRPLEQLVPEANMVDHGQSMNAGFYGGIAMREAMIRYYDGDVDRALAMLDDADNDEYFARLWLMAEEADLDGRPCPWGANR